MITLYINGRRADLSDEIPVQMTFAQEDLTNPSAVKNSYSQQLSLPCTQANNAIFGHMAKADCTTGVFNPLERTPFALYNEMSEIVQAGYLKLDDITSDSAGNATYKVTLFGGLGGFLYSLMYDAQGNKKTLASLNYGTDLSFRINRTSVRNAWRQIAGLESTHDRWNIINFAPCYNGIPSTNFEAGKALANAGVVGAPKTITANNKTYVTKGEYTLLDFGGKYDEMAVKDLRSYLQRPAIKVSKIVDACCNAANNGGYSVTLDPAFFKANNPYYNNAWMTLGRFDQMTISQGSTGTTRLTRSDNWTTIDTTDEWTLSQDYTSRHFSVAMTIGTHAELSSGNSYTSFRMGMATQPSGRAARLVRNFLLYQLVAYDADNNVIAGSDVISLQSSIDSAPTIDPTWAATLSTTELMTKGGYTPLYGNILAEAGTAYVGKFLNQLGGLTLDFVSDDASVPTLSLECDNAAKIVLRKTMCCYQSGTTSYNELQVFGGTSGAVGYALDNYVADADGNAAWSDNSFIRSGAMVTQSLLLGGTKSPAEYLLSFCKQFGLRMMCDTANKQITIMARNTFFTGDTLDIENRIDRSHTTTLAPFVFDKKWYEWGNGAPKGAFADYYKNMYGIAYGRQRVNTGYPFNADISDELKDSAFTDAVCSIERNRYMYNITENGKRIPSPAVEGKTKYKLWAADGSEYAGDYGVTGAATIDPINQSYPSYDYASGDKAQFHDDAGKPLDGANVLLFYRGGLTTGYYGRLCLTDDLALMQSLVGNPCWLVEQSILTPSFAISNTLPYPVFARHIRSGNTITLQMDMGTPQEIDEPSGTIQDGTDVYSRAWKRYIADRYDKDTRVMTCHVNLRGLQVGVDLLRKFFWFDGCIWTLNKIKNYAVGADQTTECEFVKVNDKTNYTTGQTF